MTEQTAIEWTDFTVNFWEGCQKVGPGCDHCYAEARDVRFTGGSHWGPGAPRRKVKGGISKLRRINKDATGFHAIHGRWPRVFCSSLADVFDNAVDSEWRVEAFTELDRATDTRPQLLTKRVGNVKKMVPPMWRDGAWPQHVGLMITVVDQAEADRDIPKLLELKWRLNVPWIGLSMEPLLGPVNLEEIGLDTVTDYDSLRGVERAGNSIRTGGAILDWVVCGGESGPNARPMHPDWARALRDQCEAAGTPFLFKQWGEWTDGQNTGPNARPIPAANWLAGEWDFITAPPARPDDHIDDEPDVFRIGKKRAGRLLDGRPHDGFPGALL